MIRNTVLLIILLPLTSWMAGCKEPSQLPPEPSYSTDSATVEYRNGWLLIEAFELENVSTDTPALGVSDVIYADFESLKRFRCLEALTLSSNRINEFDERYLCQYLESSNLTLLRIEDTRIGWETIRCCIASPTIKQLIILSCPDVDDTMIRQLRLRRPDIDVVYRGW